MRAYAFLSAWLAFATYYAFFEPTSVTGEIVHSTIKGDLPDPDPRGWRIAMLASSLFHWLARELAAPMTRFFWREGFGALEDESRGGKPGLQAKWVNTVVSLVHAIVSTLATYPVMLLHSDFVFSWSAADDRILQPAPVPWARWSAGITIGYLFVDVFDAIDTRLVTKKPEIMAHHFLMAYGLWTTSLFRYAELFVMYGVVCELNSIFLHMRGLMSLANYELKHTAYLTVWALLAVTFVTTRYMAHGYLAWRTYADVDKLIGYGVHWYHAHANYYAFAFLVLFNAALNWQLWGVLRRDIQKIRGGAHKHHPAPPTPTGPPALGPAPSYVEGGGHDAAATPVVYAPDGSERPIRSPEGTRIGLGLPEGETAAEEEEEREARGSSGVRARRLGRAE